jgi:hypothetical protein
VQQRGRVGLAENRDIPAVPPGIASMIGSGETRERDCREVDSRAARPAGQSALWERETRARAREPLGATPARTFLRTGRAALAIYTCRVIFFRVVSRDDLAKSLMLMLIITRPLHKLHSPGAAGRGVGERSWGGGGGWWGRGTNKVDSRRYGER